MNISPVELVDSALPERVAAALHAHGVPGSALVLEVTETSIMRDPTRSVAVMQALRELGVRFALDDFGTGYSSLAQVLAIPLDSVKIDRVFVQDIDTDPERQRFLEGVLAFTRHVGLRVVVEGVERPGQLAVLREMGCAWVQGYLLGRPVPGEEIPEQWLCGLVAVPLSPALI